MKEQLATRQQTVGKTVEKIVMTAHSEYVAIHFADNTVFVLRAISDYDDVSIFESSPIIPHIRTHILEELEIITAEEYAVIYQKKVAKRKAVEEAEERKQYEKLKAKFECAVEIMNAEDVGEANDN